MSKEQPNQDYEFDLEQHLVKHKVGLFDIEPLYSDDKAGQQAVANAGKAWSVGKAGIRAVLDHRMIQIRDKMLFDCQPFELPIYRQMLAEYGEILEEFERAGAEHDKRTEVERETKTEETPEEDIIDVTAEPISSMEE